MLFYCYHKSSSINAISIQSSNQSRSVQTERLFFVFNTSFCLILLYHFTKLKR